MEAESWNEKCGLEDWKTVEEYFKNYDDERDRGDEEGEEEIVVKDKKVDECEVSKEEDDDFEKL